MSEILQGTMIELFELDATKRGGSIQYMSNSTNEFGTPIVWRGVPYDVVPVEASGYEVTSSGKLPRPGIKIANVNGWIAALAHTYGDFIGCKVTRRRTLGKYLDPENFIGGNPNYDPAAEFAPDVFYVEQKVSEDPRNMQWSLSAAMDLDGVIIPKRTVALTCTWRYKGKGCNYAGAEPPGETTCPHTVTGCKARFGPLAELPFGGFSAVGIRRG